MRSASCISAAAAVISVLCAAPASTMMIESSRLAFVNVRKIFREMDRVQKAKDELDDIIQNKKMEISDTERAIVSVRKKIADAEKARKVPLPPLPGIGAQEGVADSTSTVSAPEEPVKEIPGFTPSVSELENYKKLLLDQEAELNSLIEESRELILKKETSFRIKVMGQIYDEIERIAKEEGYTVVLDRESIIYSAGTAKEITEEVIRRLNAKPY